MSDRFQIRKSETDDAWLLDYPDGFSDDGIDGHLCDSFADAIATFAKLEPHWCPICLRGAVEDRTWGWECTACGSSDVAVGCSR